MTLSLTTLHGAGLPADEDPDGPRCCGQSHHFNGADALMGNQRQFVDIQKISQVPDIPSFFD